MVPHGWSRTWVKETMRAGPSGYMRLMFARWEYPFCNARPAGVIDTHLSDVRS